MIQLSTRTCPMLQTFAEGGSDYYMKIDEAQAFDQRPFRAMLVHNYVAFRPGRGFHITKEGRQAWEQWTHTDLVRKDPTMPLTSHFDLVAYGLRVVGCRKARKAAEKPKSNKARMSGSVRDAINRSLFQHSAREIVRSTGGTCTARSRPPVHRSC
jgi:hypothetical protein